MECPICVEDIEQPLYATGRRLLCGHWYHSACIQQWFDRIGSSVCPYCKQASTELDAAQFQVRNLLIRFGMKNLGARLDGQDFEQVFEWSKRNRYNLGLEYRELNQLPIEELNQVARTVFPLLCNGGYFCHSIDGFHYQV